MSDSEKVNMELSDVAIISMQLKPIPFLMSKYLKWRLEAKALSGKLIIGELEIPLEYIELEAEIDRMHVDEETLKKMFPGVYK